MPRKPKHHKDMTSDELARRVFGPKAHKHLKRIAHESESEKPKKKPKPKS